MSQRYSRYTPREDAFPYFELSILFFASMTSAIPLTGLFPYVAFMVVDIHAAKNINEAGYVSGYLASAFMFGRILSSFYWGHVADTVGRKPVAYISCLAIIIFSITFGLSVNLWMAILSRFALGVLNPFNTLTKTLIADICCKKHQPMGMSLATGSWSVGLVIGPAIGGCLSRPCLQYPSVFGGIAFFEAFPYILPNIITAGMASLSVLLIYLYLPETAPLLQLNDATISDVEMANDNPAKKLMNDKPGCLQLLCNSKGTSTMSQSIIDLCKNPRVMRVCLAYFSISLTSIIFDEVFPLWAQASTSVGGKGYSSSKLGQIGSISGIPMMLITFIVFPYLSKAVGPVRCFRFGQFLSTSFTLSTILVSLYDISDAWIMPILVIVSSGSRCCAVIAFASTFLLTNSSVPKAQIGAVNGLAMTIGGIAKFVGPLSASILFAWSINNHFHSVPFNFSFVFILCFIFGMITLFIPIEDGDNDDAIKVEASSKSVEMKESVSNTADESIGSDTIHGYIQDEKKQTLDSYMSLPNSEVDEDGEINNLEKLEEEGVILNTISITKQSRVRKDGSSVYDAVANCEDEQ